MRERVGHGEVGRRSVGDGVGGGAGDGAGDVDDEGVRRCPGVRPAAESVAWRVGPGRGPRPVRPGRPAVAVRPPEVPRPAGRVGGDRWAGPSGPRVLIRRSVVRGGARYRLRRLVAELVLVLASAAVVVALGLLARAAEPQAPAGAGSVPAAARMGAPAPVVVTVQPGETVWEVASRVAPELSGPRRAALAERIVADNDLASVRPRAGQVLRVTAG